MMDDGDYDHPLNVSCCHLELARGVKWNRRDSNHRHLECHTYLAGYCSTISGTIPWSLFGLRMNDRQTDRLTDSPLANQAAKTSDPLITGMTPWETGMSSFTTYFNRQRPSRLLYEKMVKGQGITHRSTTHDIHT